MKFTLMLIGTLALLLIAFCYVLFYGAIVRFKHPRKTEPKALQPFMPAITEGKKWFAAQEKEDVEIPAFDGIRLVGEYLPAKGEAKGTIILVHGYRASEYRDFSCVYKLYHDMGYSLLNVHQRAHGRSGGKYITFGMRERYDCLCWAQYVCDRFGKNHPTFISGISMGAATVLMASDLDLPENIRGITADSAYISVYDEFAHVLKSMLHLPPHPFIDIAGAFAYIFAGFSFRSVSALDCVKNTRVPILFLSGEADDFVPHQYTLDLYEACASEKYIVTVAGAGHGLAFLTDREKCLTVLENFFDKYTY